jgi:hypothetical protein
MTRSGLILALALLALVALPRAASADRITVAVVPGIAVNLDAARVDTLSQDLASALAAELDIDAIGGVEVRRKLPEAGLQPDCVANQACIADVARRLEVQQLLFVVMIDTGTGGAIQVDSTWVDVVAHKSASRPAIDIAAIGEAKERFADAAQQLLPDAPVRPKPATGMGRFSPPVPRHFTLPTYVTAGATVAGIGVGLGFGLRARSKYKDCESLSPDSECSRDRKDSIRNTALIADIGWVIALSGTIATAVLYATSAESSHVIVEPTPGGVTVTALGRF